MPCSSLTSALWSLVCAYEDPAREATNGTPGQGAGEIRKVAESKVTAMQNLLHSLGFSLWKKKTLCLEASCCKPCKLRQREQPPNIYPLETEAERATSKHLPIRYCSPHNQAKRQQWLPCLF